MTARLLVPDLVLIPGGSFVMGNDRGRPDERPAHNVSVAAFLAGARPVSNAEYLAFVEATDSERPPFLDDERFADPDQPAAGISWHDAVAYCLWLSWELDRNVRLPTEAEREFASLGGREAADWPWGDGSPGQHDPYIAKLEQPHVPRPSCANGYGLLCTADNVHEWCSDWYDPAYYERSPERSPRGPRTGVRRASRGGSWRHQVKFTRLSARSSLIPSYRYNDYGFRVFADA
jgi:formylglycine-generating enzyme required for sulfatase activity